MRRTVGYFYTQNVKDGTVRSVQLSFVRFLGITFLLIVVVYSSCSEDKTTTPVRYPIPLLYDSDADWSPNGDWIVFKHSIPGEEDKGLYIIRPDGSERKMIFKEGSNARWASDGGKLVTQSILDEQMYLVDPFSGHIEKLTDDSMWKSYPSWHPNGDKIVFGVSVGHDSIAGIWELDVNALSYNRLFSQRGFAPAWDLSGEQLVFIRVNIYLSLWTASNGTIQDLINIDNLGAVVLRTPRFSHDGERILFWSQQKNPYRSVIWSFNLKTSRLSTIITNGYDPSLSPDGTKLAFSRPRSYENPEEYNGFIWILDLQTGELAQLTGK